MPISPRDGTNTQKWCFFYHQWMSGDNQAKAAEAATVATSQLGSCNELTDKVSSIHIQDQVRYSFGQNNSASTAPPKPASGEKKSPRKTHPARRDLYGYYPHINGCLKLNEAQYQQWLVVFWHRTEYDKFGSSVIILR